MPPSTRELLAAKREEARKAAPTRIQPARQASGSRAGWGGGGGGGEQIEEKNAEAEIRKAARTGKLDISSLRLERIPQEVYTDLLGVPVDQLSNPTAPAGSSTDRRNPPADPEELTMFKASDNEIRELDIEIGLFGGLLSLDVGSSPRCLESANAQLRNNQLSSLPNAFADLLQLNALDLSYNHFTDLPSPLQYLPKLDLLNLSHNRISTIDLTHPVEASPEGLAYGAGFLSTIISRKGKYPPYPPMIFAPLRSFNLGYNELTNEALEGMVHGDVWASMRFLNLEHNRLEGILDLRRVGIEWRTMKIEKLTLRDNARLRDITVGHLPVTTTVDMEGCNVPTQSTTTGANLPANGGMDVDGAPRQPAQPLPQASMTIVYRTTPATSFHGLPLDIDFDLYLPPEPATGNGHPLVIWFHGGGLLQGNKENLTPHLRRLPSHAFPVPAGGSEYIAVISPNYRLAPQAPIIDILSDMTALLVFVRTKLNDQLVKEGKGEHKIDTSRICLSGGSAGGYLAMIGGMRMPPRTDVEEIGGYNGEEGIKCIAPFCPISDLTDPFWATEVNPAPWMSRSISHEEAKPHLNTKMTPVAAAASGGPRSILYPYMLQHGLFPGLLFMAQRNVGTGNLAFRPTTESLSIPHRLGLLKQYRMGRPPVYFAYAVGDSAVQPEQKTLAALVETEGGLEVERREGVFHQYDEDPNEECLEFREWLGRTLL